MHTPANFWGREFTQNGHIFHIGHEKTLQRVIRWSDEEFFTHFVSQFENIQRNYPRRFFVFGKQKKSGFFLNKNIKKEYLDFSKTFSIKEMEMDFFRDAFLDHFRWT